MATPLHWLVAPNRTFCSPCHRNTMRESVACFMHGKVEKSIIIHHIHPSTPTSNSCVAACDQVGGPGTHKHNLHLSPLSLSLSSSISSCFCSNTCYYPNNPPSQLTTTSTTDGNNQSLQTNTETDVAKKGQKSKDQRKRPQFHAYASQRRTSEEETSTDSPPPPPVFQPDPTLRTRGGGSLTPSLLRGRYSTYSTVLTVCTQQYPADHSWSTATDIALTSQFSSHMSNPHAPRHTRTSLSRRSRGRVERCMYAWLLLPPPTMGTMTRDSSRSGEPASLRLVRSVISGAVAPIAMELLHARLDLAAR